MTETNGDKCLKCNHVAHNQGDCVRCTCEHQAGMPCSGDEAKLREACQRAEDYLRLPATDYLAKYGGDLAPGRENFRIADLLRAARAAPTSSAASVTPIHRCGRGGEMRPWNAAQVYRDAEDKVVLRCTACGEKKPAPAPVRDGSAGEVPPTARIVVGRSGHNYCARFETDHGKWEMAPNREEAIGKLIVSWPELFPGIVVSWASAPSAGAEEGGSA